MYLTIWSQNSDYLSQKGDKVTPSVSVFREICAVCKLNVILGKVEPFLNQKEFLKYL